MTAITRWRTTHSTVTVDGSDVASSESVEYAGYQAGQIIVPTGSSLTTLTFWTLSTDGTTWVALYDASNVAVTMTVAAARAYPIPDECRGAAWRVVGNAAGTIHVSMQG